MIRPNLFDMRTVARVAVVEPEYRRTARIKSIIDIAQAGDNYRKRTGKVLRKFGGGTKA